MKQKVKPTLWLLIIPTIIVIIAFVVAVPLMSSSFTEIADIETQKLGSEFEIEVEADSQYNVFLEIDSDEFVDSIFVEDEIVRVIIEDYDGDRDVYLFELFYYGTEDVTYDVYEPFGSSTVGELTHIFIYEFETAGTYGVLPESGDAFQTDFSVNQLDSFGLIAGVFGGVMVIFLGGFIALIITVIIFVLRHMNKKKNTNSTTQRPLPDNPFE